MASPTLFLSAGDPSGDIAASRLLDAIHEIKPDIGCLGLGGPKLKQLGQEQLADGADLAVLGFWEVAKRARFFSRLLTRCEQEIKRRSPQCIVLVDYPGFNLRLAKRVRSLGIPIVYYISPQVWAWGRSRLKKMRELVDLMLVILPFEEELYSGHGVDCHFVGHYLLEDIPQSYIGSALPGSGQLALLPGSRRQEIDRMLPVMLRSASAYCRQTGNRAVVAAVLGVYDFDSAITKYSPEGVQIVYDDPRRVLYESDLVLTASGTATLETAIIGRPMVIIYKTSFLTYQIARWLVKVDKIGLVNWVLGEKVVPELIQGDASQDNILRKLLRYRDDGVYRDQILARLKSVPGLLGGPKASHGAAELILQKAGEY